MGSSESDFGRETFEEDGPPSTSSKLGGGDSLVSVADRVRRSAQCAFDTATCKVSGVEDSEIGTMVYGKQRLRKESEDKERTTDIKEYDLYSQYVHQDMKNILAAMVTKEQHHIRYLQRDDNGDVQELDWCPAFSSRRRDSVNERSVSHHKCNCCRLLAMRLVGHGSDAKCVNCVRKGLVMPDWYFHECDNCSFSGSRRYSMDEEEDTIGDHEGYGNVLNLSPTFIIIALLFLFGFGLVGAVGDYKKMKSFYTESNVPRFVNPEEFDSVEDYFVQVNTTLKLSPTTWSLKLNGVVNKTVRVTQCTRLVLFNPSLGVYQVLEGKILYSAGYPNKCTSPEGSDMWYCDVSNCVTYMDSFACAAAGPCSVNVLVAPYDAEFDNVAFRQEGVSFTVLGNEVFVPRDQNTANFSLVSTGVPSVNNLLKLKRFGLTTVEECSCPVNSYCKERTNEPLRDFKATVIRLIGGRTIVAGESVVYVLPSESFDNGTFVQGPLTIYFSKIVVRRVFGLIGMGFGISAWRAVDKLRTAVTSLIKATRAQWLISAAQSKRIDELQNAISLLKDAVAVLTTGLAEVREQLSLLSQRVVYLDKRREALTLELFLISSGQGIFSRASANYQIALLSKALNVQLPQHYSVIEVYCANQSVCRTQAGDIDCCPSVVGDVFVQGQECQPVDWLKNCTRQGSNFSPVDDFKINFTVDLKVAFDKLRDTDVSLAKSEQYGVETRRLLSEAKEEIDKADAALRSIPKMPWWSKLGWFGDSTMKFLYMVFLVGCVVAIIVVAVFLRRYFTRFRTAPVVNKA